MSRRTSAPRGTPSSPSPGRCGWCGGCARAWWWAWAATRRSRRWSAPASRASRRWCTRPTPIPAWPTGSRCASVPAPRSPSPGRRSPGRWSPAIPIRPAIAAVRRAPVTPPLVAVVGGSLGARSLNQAVLGLYDRWRDRSDVMIHHVSGVRDYEECRIRLEALRRPGDALGYRLVPFEEHMEAIYTDADAGRLPLGRDDRGAHRGRRARGAGAAPRRARRPPDRERGGAGRGRRRGGGRAMPPSTRPASTPSSTALLADPDRRRAMGDAARALGRPDATARFADLVEEVAGAR